MQASCRGGVFIENGCERGLAGEKKLFVSMLLIERARNRLGHCRFSEDGCMNRESATRGKIFLEERSAGEGRLSSMDFWIAPANCVYTPRTVSYRGAFFIGHLVTVSLPRPSTRCSSSPTELDILPGTVSYNLHRDLIS